MPINALERAKRHLVFPQPADTASQMLLMKPLEVIADLIRLCETQQAELEALRVLREVHAPQAEDVFNGPDAPQQRSTDAIDMR